MGWIKGLACIMIQDSLDLELSCYLFCFQHTWWFSITVTWEYNLKYNNKGIYIYIYVLKLNLHKSKGEKTWGGWTSTANKDLLVHLQSTNYHHSYCLPHVIVYSFCINQLLKGWGSEKSREQKWNTWSSSSSKPRYFILPSYNGTLLTICFLIEL